MKQILNIRHFGIVINDMEFALRFYRDILGLTIVIQQILTGDFIKNILKLEELTYVKLKTESNQYIELYYSPQLKIDKNEFHHIAFTVNDIEEWYNRLPEVGIAPLSAPQVDGLNKCKVMFLRDFDGNLCEFVEELHQ